MKHIYSELLWGIGRPNKIKKPSGVLGYYQQEILMIWLYIGTLHIAKLNSIFILKSPIFCRFALTLFFDYNLLETSSESLYNWIITLISICIHFYFHFVNRIAWLSIKVCQQNAIFYLNLNHKLQDWKLEYWRKNECKCLLRL